MVFLWTEAKNKTEVFWGTADRLSFNEMRQAEEEVRNKKQKAESI